MSVLDSNQLERHGCSAFHGIFSATGWTKTAMTAEGNKFKVSAVRTAVHSPAKSRITTIDHLFDVFQLGWSWMESIFNFFVIVTENFLEYIHKIIMNENETKRNPTPQD